MALDISYHGEKVAAQKATQSVVIQLGSDVTSSEKGKGEALFSDNNALYRVSRSQSQTYALEGKKAMAASSFSFVMKAL